MGFGYAVYLTERDKNRVLRWDPDSGAVDVVAGEPSDGAQDQKLYDPYGLAFDKSGKLLITDKLHHRIARLGKGKLEDLPLKDTTGHRNRLATSRRGYQPFPLYSPAGIFTELGGSILAAFYNDQTVYRVHADGRLEHVLGMLPNRNYFITERRESVAPKEVLDTPLNKPAGIVSRSDGTIFLIERGSQVVREYHPQRGLRTLFPLSRQLDWNGESRAPAEAAISEYCSVYPGALALDQDENLFLAEAWHRCVLAIDLAAGRVTRVMESRQSAAPGRGGISALAFGPDGTAWIMDAGAGVVEAYQPTPRKPWSSLGVVLREIKGIPLQLPIGGGGMAVGA